MAKEKIDANETRHHKRLRAQALRTFERINDEIQATQEAFGLSRPTMVVRPDDPDGKAMLALSVRQPWASQIADGSKRFEYRDWSTDYRGDMLIAASAAKQPGVDPLLPRGCAICVVDVVGIREVDDTDPNDIDYTFAWMLANPRPVRPVPVKGRLGLWEVSPELARLLGLVVELVK